MGITTDEDVVERVRDEATSASQQGTRPFKVEAFRLGEYLLPFPIRMSDIDSMEDEERFGVRT